MNDCIVRVPRGYEEDLSKKGFERNKWLFLYYFTKPIQLTIISNNAAWPISEDSEEFVNNCCLQAIHVNINLWSPIRPRIYYHASPSSSLIKIRWLMLRLRTMSYSAPSWKRMVGDSPIWIPAYVFTNIEIVWNASKQRRSINQKSASCLLAWLSRPLPCTTLFMKGGTEIGAGHPQVYIQLNTKTPGVPVSCKWCGIRYALKHHHWNDSCSKITFILSIKL